MYSGKEAKFNFQVGGHCTAVSLLNCTYYNVGGVDAKIPNHRHDVSRDPFGEVLLRFPDWSFLRHPSATRKTLVRICKCVSLK